MRFPSLCIKDTTSSSLLGFLVIVMALSGCSSFSKLSKGRAEIAMASITDNPSGATFPGRFIWHDLVTPDLRSAGRFYEKLFNWQIEYLDYYAVVRNNGKRIAGILQMKPQKSKTPGVWVPSVSVPDVDSASQLVQAGGGQIVNGPVDMERRGRTVLIRDPLGTNIVLLSAKGGDPVETEVATGDWLWDEIWTNDPAKTENFYISILGYDDVLSIKEDYDIFIQKGKWLAGIRHVEGSSDKLLWVPIVRVANPDATAQLTKDLGGSVLITPDQAPNKGNTALISDPTGALLLIQRWPSKSPAEGD
ncbi:VOC family protein [Desulfogranum marinum]|uniref:VOC family protein n=1 Tax=Desulfogranum marinum TaxID=453220 RepID=UPI0029C65B6B|nr:VOC family protein [Desulfogranum marinum]